MKTKIFIATLAFAFFGIVGAQAQEKKEHSDHDHAKMEKMEAKGYTCSMHPEVSGKKGESCPKCGMNLVEKKMDGDKMAKGYTCSMHPEVSGKKGESCPKCGMALVEKKMDMDDKKMDMKKEDGHNHSH